MHKWCINQNKKKIIIIIKKKKTEKWLSDIYRVSDSFSVIVIVGKFVSNIYKRKSFCSLFMTNRYCQIKDEKDPRS